MARLTREDVLNVKDTEQKEIEIPNWGGSILIQSISAQKRERIVRLATDDKGVLNAAKFQALLILSGCVDPKFEKADIDALADKRAGVIGKIAEEIALLSGINDGAVEEAEKNFE